MTAAMTAAMTRGRLFEVTVIDGGALGAAAIDIATRTTIAGYAHDELVTPPLLDLLLRTARPGSPLALACGGPPSGPARELMIAGPGRALYCAVLDRGELVILAAPAAMSVALGWALVRTLIATGER